MSRCPRTTAKLSSPAWRTTAPLWPWALPCSRPPAPAGLLRRTGVDGVRDPSSPPRLPPLLVRAQRAQWHHLDRRGAWRGEVPAGLPGPLAAGPVQRVRPDRRA
eukprot:3747978-Heterocapsa_arctica.AAC.1